MTVHHVIVAEPYSLDPDELDRIALHHVSEGEGCWIWDVCREPHLWLDALWSIADDEGTDQGIRDLALGTAWDAEDHEHVWHGQRHVILEGEWRVIVDGCWFKEADLEYDLTPDLLPGVYAVTCEQEEWGISPDASLTDEPVPNPEQFLKGAR